MKLFKAYCFSYVSLTASAELELQAFKHFIVVFHVYLRDEMGPLKQDLEVMLGKMLVSTIELVALRFEVLRMASTHDWDREFESLSHFGSLKGKQPKIRARHSMRYGLRKCSHTVRQTPFNRWQP